MTGVNVLDSLTGGTIALLGAWMVVEIGIRWALAAFRRTTEGAPSSE